MKVTNMNLEQDFILVDILWIIYLEVYLYIKEFVMLMLQILGAGSQISYSLSVSDA
jgi:hypothetical protein